MPEEKIEKTAEEKTKKGSKKQEKKKISEKEFEDKVVELAKTCLTSEKIGEKLRQEGIHPAEQGKKISKILKEKNMYTNPDTKNVKEKLDRITAHYSKNKQDRRSMREKDRMLSHYKKLEEYHKR